MGKVKYNEEMKLQTVKYVLEGGKSATKVAKELGIDTKQPAPSTTHNFCFSFFLHQENDQPVMLGAF